MTIFCNEGDKRKVLIDFPRISASISIGLKVIVLLKLLFERKHVIISYRRSSLVSHILFPGCWAGKEFSHGKSDETKSFIFQAQLKSRRKEAKPSGLS